jgi:hypothetical protein
MSSNCNSTQSLMKLEFSRQISKHFLNNKFNKNQFNGNRVVLCWRTDGQRNYENINLFLQFCKRELKPGFKQDKTQILTDNTGKVRCSGRSVGAVTRSCARRLKNSGSIPGREKTFFSPNPPANTVDYYIYAPNAPAIWFLLTESNQLNRKRHIKYDTINSTLRTLKGSSSYKVQG